MKIQFRTLRHAGLIAYAHPNSPTKWHLPVCASQLKTELSRLNPKNASCWEDVDLDGCPTMCYVLTDGLIKSMNNVKTFTAFFSILSNSLGEGPVHRFFPDLWVRNHNIMAAAKNVWEVEHGIRTKTVSYASMSIRKAARMSIY